MELSPEPVLPVPLPRPLSDPLRRYRWGLLFGVPLLWASVTIGLLLPDVSKVREAAARTRTTNNLDQISLAVREHASANSGKVPPAWAPDSGGETFNGGASANFSHGTIHYSPRPLHVTAGLAAWAATCTVLFCTLCLLPRRATNAIYLRSFRNDATTGALRTAAQAALGRAFRLSGIRDPRRRWPALMRHFLYLLFLIRYAQPKFMNLEAGRDWKARLWRSLGEARCALIDVTELTPFVREEIELAVRCLGFHRVLFIGNDSLTADEWRQTILAALGRAEVPLECIRVALWADTAAGRATFRDQVRAFAGGLPADAPGLNAAAFPEAASSDPGGHAVTGESWGTFLVAVPIGVAVTGALLWAEKRTPDAGLAWFFPTAIYDTLAFLLLLQYFAVCGSRRQRLRLGGIFFFAAVFAGLPIVRDLVARSEGREVLAREDSAHNMREIGAALWRYEKVHKHPVPLAICRADGTPLLSWRVLLLPMLNEEGLFRQFHLDEPWDSPHNLALLKGIPVVYRSPYPSQADRPTDTPYQMITGADTIWGERRPVGLRPQRFFQGGGGWGATTSTIRTFRSPSDRMVAAPDGSSNLIPFPEWRPPELFVFDPPFQFADLRGGRDTLLMVEAADAAPWTKPEDFAYHLAGDRSTPDEIVRRLGPTRSGFSVLLGNGEVRRFDRSPALAPQELDALITPAPLAVDPAPEKLSPEQLAAEVSKVDTFLVHHPGTRAAEGLKQWRARAGEVLKKWQAEDRRAKGAPVKVSLAVLLAEYRANPQATNEKYARKWLLVVGKVARKPYAPMGIALGTGAVMPLSADLILEVKPEDKSASRDVFVCSFPHAAPTVPGGAGKGKSVASLKVGDTVTILGKWPPLPARQPPPLGKLPALPGQQLALDPRAQWSVRLLPYLEQSGIEQRGEGPGPCQLGLCELAR